MRKSDKVSSITRTLEKNYYMYKFTFHRNKNRTLKNFHFTFRTLYRTFHDIPITIKTHLHNPQVEIVWPSHGASPTKENIFRSSSNPDIYLLCVLVYVT